MRDWGLAMDIQGALLQEQLCKRFKLFSELGWRTNTIPLEFGLWVSLLLQATMAENNDRSSDNRQANSSWLMRANYSHTVCHRLDPLKRISSFPSPSSFGKEAQRDRPMKKPIDPVSNQAPVSKLAPAPVTAQCPKSVDKRGPNVFFRKRSPSPAPQTTTADAFKEEKSRSKRFLTPPRKVSDDLINKTPWARYGRGGKVTDTLPRSPSSSPVLGSFSPAKSPDLIGKIDFKHAISWSKYIQQPGGGMTSVETDKDWMVDLSKLFLGQKFAAGAHSRLYHGLYNEKPVAVKIIAQPDGDEYETMAICLEEQFHGEVTILSHLHHRNVVQLVAAFKKPPVFCIITEYLSGGSLRTYLHKRGHGLMPLKEIVSIALDIARGMEYLHSQGVVHRDLKSENLLFSDDMCLKVVDFGIACEEASCDYSIEEPGTYRWMAPEIISHKAYNKKVDVYSFGIVLWEIVTGRIPYEDMTGVQAAFAVLHKNARPPLPAECPVALLKLMEQCWAHNPDKRPDFWEIVKILEKFEASLLHDGTLNMCQNAGSQERRHQLPHWRYWIGRRNLGNATISPDK